MCPTIIWDEEIYIYCIPKVWYNYPHLGENEKLNFWGKFEERVKSILSIPFSCDETLKHENGRKILLKTFQFYSFSLFSLFLDELACKRQHYHSLMDRINTLKSIETKLKLSQFFI